MTIVVTGATGFVGRHAVKSLVFQGHQVRACVRTESSVVPVDTERIVIPDICGDIDWTHALRGANCVLHIAGRAHSDPTGDVRLEAEFRRVNVTATEELARAALAAGVSRFVFVSSIGVNGSSTSGKAFTGEDVPAPSDFYALTKLEAEESLRRICGDREMELVIIRPTLVVGANAPGNLARLAALVRKSVPLPIGRIHNQRSLIGVRSLANLLALSCVHPDAAGCVFVAADDPPLSTAEIVMEIAAGLGVKARLLQTPVPLMKAVGSITGRSRDVERLCGSLEVDATLTRATLDWHASHSIQTELRELGSRHGIDA